MENKTLIPCKYCGKIPIITEFPKTYYRSAYYLIRCHDDKCKVQPANQYAYADKSEAIKEWNEKMGIDYMEEHNETKNHA